MRRASGSEQPVHRLSRFTDRGLHDKIQRIRNEVGGRDRPFFWLNRNTVTDFLDTDSDTAGNG